MDFDRPYTDDRCPICGNYADPLCVACGDDLLYEHERFGADAQSQEGLEARSGESRRSPGQDDHGQG